MDVIGYDPAVAPGSAVLALLAVPLITLAPHRINPIASAYLPVFRRNSMESATVNRAGGDLFGCACHFDTEGRALWSSAS